MATPQPGAEPSASGTVYGASRIAEGRVAQSLLGNLELTAHGLTLMRDDVLDTQRKWSDCMASTGYLYSTFLDARYAFASVSPEAYDRIAKRDRQCVESTGPALTYRDAYDAECAALYEANAELITQFLEAQAEAVTGQAG